MSFGAPKRPPPGPSGQKKSAPTSTVGLTDKLGEIRKMQRAWMNQRDQSPNPNEYEANSPPDQKTAQPHSLNPQKTFCRSEYTSANDHQNRADNVIDRVRNELLDIEKETKDQVRSSITSTNTTPGGLKAYSNSPQSTSARPLSHHCSKCRSLMITAQNAPAFLIPCGHSLCLECAEYKVKHQEACPTCGCVVSSVTLNHVMQNIIVGYAASSSTNPKTVPESTSGAFSADRREWSDKILSVQSRLEALENDQMKVSKEVSQLENESSQLESQVLSAENQMAEKEKEIQQLQQQIVDLQDGRNETLRRRKDIIQILAEKKDNLQHLKNTKQAVESELDKLSSLCI